MSLKIDGHEPEFQSLGVPGRGSYSEEARLKRLNFISKKKNLDLKNLSHASLPSESLRGNIENYLTTIDLPVGLAGPLKLKGTDFDEVIYAPLATTEGALIASTTRGAVAITRSGGAVARTLRQRMTRAPMFEFSNVEEALDFAEWLRERLDPLKKLVKKFSSHAELLDIHIRFSARAVHTVFVYTTQDAAGQNMTTICTWNSIQWIVRQSQSQSKFRIVNYVLDGNLSSDKKASVFSVIQGRGTEVIAEAVVLRKYVREILLANPEDLVHKINLARSARLAAGMIGWNVNAANVVAAVFGATGQDLACISESSVGEFYIEMQGEDIYVSLHLPNLVLGTIGGGTCLPRQREMLQLMGCTGLNSSRRLAEIICGFSLGLEISTASALDSGHFAQAHQKLGRTQVKNWLRRAEIDLEFVESCLHEALIPGQKIISIREEENPEIGDSLIMEMSSQVTQKICGFFKFNVETELSDGRRSSFDLLLKVKPTDDEVIQAAESMASLWSEDLPSELKKNRDISPFRNCHIRELEMAGLAPEIQPPTYKALRIPERQIFLLCQKWITGLELKDTAGDVRGWTQGHLEAAISQIARFHSKYLNNFQTANKMSWLLPFCSAETLARTNKQVQIISDAAKFFFEDWASKEDLESFSKIVREVELWSASIYRLPHTLIHHDFNPRNVAFEKNLKLCVFDWELASFGLPQRDSVELLAFVLGEDLSIESLKNLLELHRQELQKDSGVILHKSEWILGASIAIKEFIYSRISMYFVAHSQRHCDFLPRTFKTAIAISKLLEKEVQDEHFNAVTQ